MFGVSLACDAKQPLWNLVVNFNHCVSCQFHLTVYVFISLWIFLILFFTFNCEILNLKFNRCQSQLFSLWIMLIHFTSVTFHSRCGWEGPQFLARKQNTLPVFTPTLVSSILPFVLEANQQSLILSNLVATIPKALFKKGVAAFEPFISPDFDICVLHDMFTCDVVCKWFTSWRVPRRFQTMKHVRPWRSTRNQNPGASINFV